MRHLLEGGIISNAAMCVVFFFAVLKGHPMLILSPGSEHEDETLEQSSTLSPMQHDMHTIDTNQYFYIHIRICLL